MEKLDQINDVVSMTLDKLSCSRTRWPWSAQIRIARDGTSQNWLRCLGNGQEEIQLVENKEERDHEQGDKRREMAEIKTSCFMPVIATRNYVGVLIVMTATRSVNKILSHDNKPEKRRCFSCRSHRSKWHQMQSFNRLWSWQFVYIFRQN